MVEAARPSFTGAPLRYAMVGGGRDALIGPVHRKAAALDGTGVLVAGALSSDAERARASGRELGLADQRNHGRWQDLLEDELKRPKGERIDFVVIVTPNHLHHPVARAFAEAGLHVVCDKPLVHTVEQAEDLVRCVQRAGTVFGVTYNYTGYPMVRQARQMVRDGVLGEIRKVIVEYHQGWLAKELTNHKQAEWRGDPARSGPAGALGDIGSHAENLASTITGLQIESLSAELTTFVAGRRLDDDCSMLLRFAGGARGVLLASQIAVGHENDLRIRIFGSAGSLAWRQEDPNRLVHLSVDGPQRVLTRGSPGLCEAARRATRIPPGHPEGFIEAFANLYVGIGEAVRAHARGGHAEDAGDYPRLADGVRGVRFIDRAIESARSQGRWTSLTS